MNIIHVEPSAQVQELVKAYLKDTAHRYWSVSKVGEFMVSLGYVMAGLALEKGGTLKSPGEFDSLIEEFDEFQSNERLQCLPGLIKALYRRSSLLCIVANDMGYRDLTGDDIARQLKMLGVRFVRFASTGRPNLGEEAFFRKAFQDGRRGLHDYLLSLPEAWP